MNMKRHEWEFEYTASAIADGAEIQRLYRQGRVEWWEKQKAVVMAEVRDSGIEVAESVAAATSNYSGGQMGPRVMVRADLQAKLTECHQKIELHRSAVIEYAGWVQVLRANPEQRLKLTQSDWLHFFEAHDA